MSTEEDASGMAFHHRNGGVSTNQVSEKASGLAMSSGSMFKSSSGPDPFFGSGWDPIASLSQSENFGGGSSSGIPPHSGYGNSPYSVMMENQGMPMASSSHHFHYPADSGLVEMVPKFYGSGGFSAMVGGSFGLPDPGQIANFIPNKANHENTSTNGAASQGDQQISEEGAMRISPCGKRKKGGSESNSPYNPSKNGEGEQQNDVSGDSSENPKDQDEKKQKIEQNTRGKQTGKQAKDSSNSGEAPKDSYIHVRARRGQATNSHSLAERVRRERISERMRLLQELVPGCNKITGKAVMLDEIINYVQSLQQQVEFLSMKLATVNPQLNIDIDRILSKEILQSRGSAAGLPGFVPGMSSSNPYAQGIPRGALQGLAASSPFNPMPQNLWDTDLQSLLQMGFDSTAAISNMGPNGQSKMEL